MSMTPDTTVYAVAYGDTLSAWTDKAGADTMYTVAIGANLDAMRVTVTYARWLEIKAELADDADTEITEHFAVCRDCGQPTGEGAMCADCLFARL